MSTGVVSGARPSPAYLGRRRAARNRRTCHVCVHVRMRVRVRVRVHGMYNGLRIACASHHTARQA